MSEGMTLRSHTKDKTLLDEVTRSSDTTIKVEGEDGSKVHEFTVPNFTNKQLLDAIPAHCFERSAIRSSFYVVQDVTIIGICAYFALNMNSLLLGRLDLSGNTYTLAKVTLWTIYTFVVGLFGTGLWVIGHECGHQAFSSSKTINNTVGWMIHSALLVPYHAWRISHSTHHAACGHLTRDQVFVPKTRKMRGIPPKEEDEAAAEKSPSSHRSELLKAVEESPLYTLLTMIRQQLLGFPAYLILNTSGQKHYPANTNHFNPSAVLFRPDHFWQVIASNLGIAINIATLSYWAYKRSFSEMALMYLISYLWVNHWLLFIVYLQHTDPMLPHYSSNEWTFARGALATIDRNLLGPIGPYVFHGICETHVAHHISSKIPHYNAWEATEALKVFLGPHYQFSDESMFKAFWHSMRECIFVEENEDVAFYKNWKGTARQAVISTK